MNIIVIMTDTLRPDYLQAYGNDWVRSPNSARFAQTAAVFENSFVGSFPTIPNRTDLFTGRFGEPLHPWLPLDFAAVTLPEILRNNGYVTQFMCDTPHMIQGGHNFDYPFHAWEYFRGSEVDRFGMDHLPCELPYKDKTKVQPSVINRWDYQFMRNARGRRVERDWTTYQTFQASIDWLELNRKHEKFFLWIDVFDPHEPQLPPQHYTDLYDPDYDGDIYLAHVKDVSLMSEAEINNVKARYAGSVTFVDRQAGRLLDTVDLLGLADDTMIIWMSDHGTHLGEHNMMLCKDCGYDEVARMVLMARAPKGKGGESLAAGKRFKDLVQPADLAPTLLDFAGIEIPEVMQGVSYRSLFEGGAWSGRDVAITGRDPRIDQERKGTLPIVARDQRWRLLDMPQPERRRLFDIQNDPEQLTNVAAKHPAEVERLHNAVVTFLKAHGAPEPVAHYWETGDNSKMAGKDYMRPGCEKYSPYFMNIWETGMERA